MKFIYVTQGIHRGSYISAFCDLLRSQHLKFLNYDKFMSVKIVLILANSADLDEMLPYQSLFFSTQKRVQLNSIA